jgi:hypothetical protein
MESKDTRTWKILVLALIIGLLGGVVSAALVAPLFLKPGPQGPQGEIGATGPQGTQGVQGIQGIPGTDAILQIHQNRNDTQVNVGSYINTQWFNMSDFDASMRITINIQQNSKILVQFSSSHTLDAGDSILVRVVVDNTHNSSTCKASAPSPPSSGTYTFPGQVEFLSDPLSAGQHTVEVQFLKETSPIVLARTLTVTEITSP